MSLVRQFTIVASVVTIAAMTMLGAWVANDARNDILRSSAFANALLMKSFFAPHVSAIAATGTIALEDRKDLDRLFSGPLSNAGIRSLKIWNPDGSILYVSGDVLIPEDVGPARLARAVAGEVVVNFEDDYTHPELSTPFIEIYVPLYPDGSNTVVAVGEFHQEATLLEAEVSTTYATTWAAVGLVAVGMIIALYVVVLRGHKTITEQQDALQLAAQQSEQSSRQNEALRVISDKTRIQAAEVNEQLLGRVGADLHDGPIQVLSVLNFKLTHLLSTKTSDRKSAWKDPEQVEANLREQVGSLVTLNTAALEELRSISEGLVLPELSSLTLNDTLQLAVSRHEAHSGGQVKYHQQGLPTHTSHLVKTCLYRIVQEALNNSARYAGGAGQQVLARASEINIHLEVLDTGPGINQVRFETVGKGGLGLLGMASRINALGGSLDIAPRASGGTRISVDIPIAGIEAANWP